MADMLRYRPQAPYDSQPGHHFEKIIRDVDLPPEKALAGGNGVMVMIVVPTLAECDQGQERVVAAGVRIRVTPGSDHVVQGVDGYRRVKEHGGGDESPQMRICGPLVPSAGATASRTAPNAYRPAASRMGTRVSKRLIETSSG